MRFIIIPSPLQLHFVWVIFQLVRILNMSSAYLNFPILQPEKSLARSLFTKGRPELGSNRHLELVSTFKIDLKERSGFNSHQNCI